jgi:aminopeptidase N
MKLRSLILATTLILAGGCAPPPAERPAPPVAWAGAEPEPIEAGRAPPPGPYAPGFRPLHYDVGIVLPREGTRIFGRAVVHVAIEEPVATVLPLDFTGLAVEAVRIGGARAGYRHDAGILRVGLPPGVRAGDTVRVEVLYHGSPDDGLILRQTIHGRPAAFADNWPNRARFWFPALDHPGLKATVAFTVSAPADRRVIANGLPLATGGAGLPPVDTLGPDRRIHRWRTDRPLPTYLMVIGAAELTVSPLGTSCAPAASPPACIEVSAWAFRPDSAFADSVFRRAPAMVDYYAGLIAPHPYEKLAHVQSSTRFGGMENASAIFYDERALAQRRDIEGTVAHEIAHQWFGNAVTPADWPHLWLSEGFATYFGALFFEHADGMERFRRMVDGMRQGYLRATVHDRPVVDTLQSDLFALLNANSYQKGGLILHMLRGLVGDSAFFRGVRSYYRAHEHGNARSEDLRRALEEAAGRDLGWFFEQWLRGPGHPRLALTTTWDAARREAVVSVRQVQSTAWPTFRLPLTVELTTARGTTRRSLEMTGREAALRVPLDEAPTRVVLDPDGWLLIERVD